MACRIKRASNTAEDLLGECEIEAEELTGMLEELKGFSRPYLKLLPDKRLYARGEDFLRLRSAWGNTGARFNTSLANLIGITGRCSTVCAKMW